MDWPGGVAEASGVAGRASSAPKSELSADGWQRRPPKLNPSVYVVIIKSHALTCKRAAPRTARGEIAGKSSEAEEHQRSVHAEDGALERAHARPLLLQLNVEHRRLAIVLLPL